MNSRGTVYFIQEEQSGPVKIGWTTRNVEDRLISLQTGNSRELRIIATISNVTQTVEIEWHERFRGVACRAGRVEWFWPTREFMEAVDAQAQPFGASKRKRRNKLVRAPWVVALQRWMEAEGFSYGDLANLLGYSQTYAVQLMYGRCALTVPAAQRIELASSGKLSAASLLQSTNQTSDVVRFLAQHREAA